MSIGVLPERKQLKSGLTFTMVVNCVVRQLLILGALRSITPFILQVLVVDNTSFFAMIISEYGHVEGIPDLFIDSV